MNKMFQYTPSGIKFKPFVKETDGENQTEKPNASRKYLPVTRLTGDKAKAFYEDIINQPSNPVERKLMVRPKFKAEPFVRPVLPKTRTTDLLRMAQNNNVKEMSAFFAQPNHDVNVTDDFGWTPLMCAACSGAAEAVQILLENGADPHKCDRLGNTALTLALNKNHKRIVEILKNFATKLETVEDSENPPKRETFFCPLCKGNFTTSKNSHESSTLHLFNCPFKAQTFYGIPESNKGFQLLLREGWNKEKGLGPEGTGRKFPVKATMKKDRTGIGAMPPPDRIERDANHTEKYENKKRRTYYRWKEKDFEKKFRLEFS